MTKDGDKQVGKAVLNRTVIETLPPPPEGAPPTLGGAETALLWFVAQVADEIVQWGTAPKLRDRQLKEFAYSESTWLSALGTVIARNVGFDWTLRGSPQVVARVQEVLNSANLGKGWDEFIAKVSMDLYTQDSGAFVEIVRAADAPEGLVIGLNHLEAARCWHTGNPEQPVVYQDLSSVFHRLKWYQVSTISEMPATVERLPGMQLCALTRMLRAAQIIKNVSIYKEEKTGGRFHRALHVVQGITQKQIQDAVTKVELKSDAQGLLRYPGNLIMSAQKPDAKVDIKTLELASLPDGWDDKTIFEQYIAIIALAFLEDYQEFAPLPGGNLGTSQQSETLHKKARGKGPALFKKHITRMMNFEVLPRNVLFEYQEQDIGEEGEVAEVSKIRAETRQIQIDSGEIDPDAARQIALDAGDISLPVFKQMGGSDVTPDVTAEDVAPLEGEASRKEGEPARAGPFRGREDNGGGEAETCCGEGSCCY